MSFVKKVVRGIVDFVKKYWKEIVIVAAVVFTAGVATIGGWSAFTTVAGEQGFMSAIGSTMWAGVTGTAGSMGIGSGASGQAAALTGKTGMGLGGGLGWGSAGKGLGVTASEYSANVMAQGASDALVKRAGEEAAKKALAEGKTMTEAQAAAMDAGKAQAMSVEAPGVSQTALAKYGPAKAGESLAGVPGAEAGMSTGEALMWSSAISTGANAAQGYMQGKMYEESMPKAAWVVDLTGKHPYTGPLPGSPGTLPGVQAGPAALQAPGPSLAGAVSGAEAGALASVRAPFAPLMAASQPFRPAPAPQLDQPLMGGGVPA